LIKYHPEEDTKQEWRGMVHPERRKERSIESEDLQKDEFSDLFGGS
jgi:hypothetical protein